MVYINIFRILAFHINSDAKVMKRTRRASAYYGININKYKVGGVFITFVCVSDSSRLFREKVVHTYLNFPFLIKFIFFFSFLELRLLSCS